MPSPSDPARDVKRTRDTTVEMWLIDTGCGHDLVTQEEMRASKHLMKTVVKPLTFHTANGPISSGMQCPIYCDEVSDYADPLRP